MRFNDLKLTFKTAVLATFVLLLGASAAVGQIKITAGPASATLPDGSSVPMWGYSCDGGANANCRPLSPKVGAWSPIVITTTAGSDLNIQLTNNLTFAGGNIPTSLTIVGQLGGGLGKDATSQASPAHNPQSLTWPVQGAPGDPQNAPPPQGPRVQSFGTEVLVGTPQTLTWTAASLRAGTYLLESGTHPSIQGPMGLYGILVVKESTPTPSAYGLLYSADIPMLLSEIDPVQNTAVDKAVRTAGFSETRVWSGQKGECGDPTAAVGVAFTCYPPAVNYTPLYYLINGVAFDKTHASASLFPASPASGAAGSVLVRLVNAGLHMHIPSVVGAQTTVNSAVMQGLGLIAEDGNKLPGAIRVQNEVFMAPGKTYDVMINVPAAGRTALPIYDRQLSLSGNATARDSGMLAYISVNGALLPTVPAFGATTTVTSDVYNAVIAGQKLVVSDPGKGVIANDAYVYSVKVATPPTKGALTLHADGTFEYMPGNSWAPDSFTYQANGSGPIATVTLNACTGACLEAASGMALGDDDYSSTVSTSLSIKSPGVLVNDSDAAGFPLNIAPNTYQFVSGPGTLTVTLDKSGSFVANASQPGNYVFSYKAQNSQGTVSSASAHVTLHFPTGSGLQVTLIDGKSHAALAGNPQDYRWIIEEDRTFYIDPKCAMNPPPAGCPGANNSTLPTFGANFHSSYMPVVAQGCTGPVSCEEGQMFLDETGNHVKAVCDQGNGVCHAGTQKSLVLPGDVALDPLKRYYISVLPGDALGVNGDGGELDTTHAMGGAEIAAGQTSVQVIVEPTPLPPAKVTVFVFEDDFPLNGENDAGGGVDSLSPNEPGLGKFNITLFDDVGGSGDAAGQMTYDMFGNPLSNALAGTPDPSNGGIDSCPVTANPFTGFDGTPSTTGITGVIPVCPDFEADGVTPSPLRGQAIIANLPPGRYGVVATPGADRISKGEEWLQTNTLDGGKAHDSFIKVGEPAYFQEFGPAGYHVAIGFANPKIINDRKAGVCASLTGNAGCTRTLTGKITGVHMTRTPDERLFSSGTRDIFGYTQCYVSIGSPDGADFAFEKCKDDGTFTFSNVPAGDWRITVFDQWNDQIVDGIATPINVSDTQATTDMGDVAVHQWKTNLYTRSFFDKNGDGVSQDNESGLSLVYTNVRYRDGSFSNFNSTDLEGFAGFNEVFPLFNWYVVETDSTRYKNTGTHVVYDAGGPVDPDPTSPTGTQTTNCGTAGYPACGHSTIAANVARTKEDVSLPVNLRVPGAVYCDNADCENFSIADGPTSSASGNLSTGRIDPAWVNSYGWQGFIGQSSFLEFGKKPFAESTTANVPGENGGIHGHVVYASTRPFDDPALLLQLSWEPLVPNVTINLYQEGVAADGISKTLKLVDTTKTTSWDDWAQGFRSDGVPNMNCPGQSQNDLFIFTLTNQTFYLDPQQRQLPNDGGSGPNAQFKCFDGMHNWNQLQPAPYDGMYSFPSMTINPQTGAVAGTNCSICITNPDASDPYRYGGSATPVSWTAGHGMPMLPPGKYVVEMIVPPGYELVKEEDKNILMGDVYVSPVTTQFAGFGNIFIMPDQAEVTAQYNPNNPLIPSTDEGITPRHEGDTGSIETFWPCVGADRVIPDYMSLFPGSGQNAPFAGAKRPLCDRKEVTLEDQMSVLAKFYVFTSTHVAAHYTGLITDDFTAEFDPFSPSFGEKFAPPNMPVSVKDWAGNEISRVYADQWGAYNGLTYSSYGVNPPDPSGYVPTMMVTCMNDAGSGAAPDPLYQPAYSQFCYETPFMPGQTQYMDTPVVPTLAFAGAGYNNPDCAYPDATPAIGEVNGQGGTGPWVSAAGQSLTIKALGDQVVNNYGYTGPSATTAPYNQKTITRHYGFGAQQGSGFVTIAGVNAPVTDWADDHITVTVPTIPSNQSTCTLSQRNVSTTNYRCGELVITAGNGKQSIDTVTVTVAGKAPTIVTPTSITNSSSTACVTAAGGVSADNVIQTAIDCATPGDLIIVGKGTYNELLLMWKPVRLQGVGAGTTFINASSHPSGKLDPWRMQVVCLFGIGPDGRSNDWDPNCGSAWNGWKARSDNPQVDRLPLEPTIGWDATLNGNLAEQLMEPSLLGAYEGAGITVLSKGVRFPQGSEPFAADTFPVGTTLLTSTTSSRDCTDFPSDFNCNPSRIDGLSVTNSSQGGGGIFVHGWAHRLEISNNRVYGNQGTLAGGIVIGQGEHPDAYLPALTIADPGSCEFNFNQNVQLPYCFDRFVNVHHNAVTSNSSLGDELFAATPSGAGGVVFCTGSDHYKFNYNWVCGNLNAGDGGGVTQLGFVSLSSNDNDLEGIRHNSILFNQSTNPTIPTNGGGIMITNAPDTDPVCGTDPDQDCPPGLGDGTGPGLVIDGNLVMGNAADSGSGGGIRFQGVNGTEISRFPRTPGQWYSVRVTNNIIANNVAGWDGGGMSLEDSLAVNIINNTIISNDSTASSGVLFNTFRSGLASAPPPAPCTSNCGFDSAAQPAGVSSVGNSASLIDSFPSQITCPAGHSSGGTNPQIPVTRSNGDCRKVSFPVLYNNVTWDNRPFHIHVGATENQYQQAVVSLVPTINQPQSGATTTNGNGAIITGGTGACVSQAATTYWDLGVRGDSGPSNHASGVTLQPLASVITSGYTGNAVWANSNTDPTVKSQYCNGSRIPPEFGGTGYQVPPGTNEGNVPVPIFSLTAGATVDEGNNWINMSWGPLSMTNPTTGTTLSNYALADGSPSIDYITPASTPTVNGCSGAGVAYCQAPSRDFFGNPRKTAGNPLVDVGAVESGAGPRQADLSVTKTDNRTSVLRGTTGVAYTITVHNGGSVTVLGAQITDTLPGSSRFTVVTGGWTCTASTGSSCTATGSGNTTRGGSVSLLAGGTATYTLTGNVPSNAPLGASTNTVTVGVPLGVSDPDLTNNSATDTDTIVVLLTPNPVVFGPQAVNTTSAAMTVTFTNNTGASITLRSGGSSNLTATNGPAVGITTGNSSNFSIAAGTTCTNGAVIPANGSCVINVTFRPSQLGNRASALRIYAAGATTSLDSDPMSGTGQ
jgi:uncharacterized repeat protein (TIGR01451 family)